MKTILNYLTCFFLLSILFSIPARAGGAMSGGAFETTQLLNYAELYNQTDTILGQLEMQRRQIEKFVADPLSIGQIGQARGRLMSLFSTVKQARGTLLTAQEQAAKWSALYPDFNSSTGSDFFSRYKGLSDDLTVKTRTALDTINTQVDGFDSDANAKSSIEQIVAQAQKSQSLAEIGNASNIIATSVHDELIKSRQLQVTQNQMMVSYITQQQGASDKAKSDSELTAIPTQNLPQQPACFKAGTCTVRDLINSTPTH